MLQLVKKFFLKEIDWKLCKKIDISMDQFVNATDHFIRLQFLTNQHPKQFFGKGNKVFMELFNRFVTVYDCKTFFEIKHI